MRVVKKIQSLNEPYNKTTVLSWNLPCRANGKIDKFLIHCARLDGLYQDFTYEVAVADNRDEYSLSTEDFTPDSRFHISIRAINGDIFGKEFSVNVLIEPGGKKLNLFKFLIFGNLFIFLIILVPDVSNWNATKIICNPSTKVAKLHFPSTIFESDVGKITKILLLLAELDCGNKVEPETGFIDSESAPRTWKKVQEESCISQYQTGSLVDNDKASKDTESDHRIVFTIGTETCETNNYCNGPLKPGKRYALTMRYFTR